MYHAIGRGVSVAVPALGIAGACAGPERSTGTATSPSSLPTARVDADNPNSAAGDTKAFIGSWLEGEGEPVALRYTRSYFCDEPPTSAAEDTECEVGAGAEVFPRPGPIPKIYALGPAGFQPPAGTIHCVAGVVCPNHPPQDRPTNVFFFFEVHQTANP